MRAAFISINMFSLLCDGTTQVKSSSLLGITKFGGPILYLVFYGLFLFTILVLADSGSILPRRLSSARRHASKAEVGSGIKPLKEDVATEARAVSNSNDLLRIVRVSKSYGDGKVVDDVSLGVSRDTAVGTKWRG
jgi:ATP-binding cassette, subfamily A (ABC1), member 3